MKNNKNFLKYAQFQWILADTSAVFNYITMRVKSPSVQPKTIRFTSEGYRSRHRILHLHYPSGLSSCQDDLSWFDVKSACFSYLANSSVLTSHHQWRLLVMLVLFCRCLLVMANLHFPPSYIKKMYCGELDKWAQHHEYKCLPMLHEAAITSSMNNIEQRSLGASTLLRYHNF